MKFIVTPLTPQAITQDWYPKSEDYGIWLKTNSQQETINSCFQLVIYKEIL